MNTWTRTLNLDDTHTLLALAEPGMGVTAWADACHDALPELSHARRAELIRLIRAEFLDVDDKDRIAPGAFLTAYASAPATVQLELVQAQWALSHPITVAAIEALVAPALASPDPAIPLGAVDAFVAAHVGSASPESLRKTRTVLLAAMEGVGALATRGTGQHRSLAAARGRPHPQVFAWLLERGGHGPDVPLDQTLPVRLTQCDLDHARRCLRPPVGLTA